MARMKNVLAVSACAFDCVPADLSVSYAKGVLFKKMDCCVNDSNSDDDEEKGRSNGGGDDSGGNDGDYNDEARESITKEFVGIEITHEFNNITCGNSTTFRAAAGGFRAAADGTLHQSRAAAGALCDAISSIVKRGTERPERWKMDCGPKLNESVASMGNLPQRWEWEKDDSGNNNDDDDKNISRYTVKFPGADASCILSSQRYNRFRDALSSSSNQTTTPPPRLAVKLAIRNRSDAYKLLAYGSIFTTLAKFEYGRKLLCNNVHLFSGGAFREGGPMKEELDKGSFITRVRAFGLVYWKKRKRRLTGAGDGDDEVVVVRKEEVSVRTICSGPEPG